MDPNDTLHGLGVPLSRSGEEEGSPTTTTAPEPRRALIAAMENPDQPNKFKCDSGIGKGDVIQTREEAAAASGGRLESSQEPLIDPSYEDLEAHDKAQGAIIADPTTDNRYYWRDPVTSIQREIWRPGDGDGDKSADYYDMLGPKPPPEKRWKFFQSRVGPGPIKHQHNEPPKYVILDDRAAQELLASNMPRTYLPKFWSHDFGGNGSIRAKRINRGRGAIGDFEAEGIHRFHFAHIGNKPEGEKYYFKGEASYKPVIWSTSDVALAIGVFKPAVKKITSPPPRKPLKANQHGHNQWTPQDELVKFGARHKNAHPRGPRVLDEGGVRGGRNRNHNFIANHSGTLGLAAARERVETWRTTTVRPGMSAGEHSERGSSVVSDHSSGRKRARRPSSEEQDEADYIKKLEMHLLDTGKLTDEQNAKIETLKGALSKAKDKIRALEEEVAALKQG